MEQIDHTCRKKIGSNINLNHSNAVEGLKIDWKQLIWMIRHGLKHKNTVSNNWATKLQSRIGNSNTNSLAIMTDIVCPNQQGRKTKTDEIYANIQIGNKTSTIGW